MLRMRSGVRDWSQCGAKVGNKKLMVCPNLDNKPAGGFLKRTDIRRSGLSHCSQIGSRRRAPHDSVAGFNVVEVMVAATIMLVGFLGIIRALTIGSESLDTARKQQLAHEIIVAEIEKLRGGTWASIANLPAAGTITIGPTGLVTGDAISVALSNHTPDPSDDNSELCVLARGLTCTFTRTYLRPAAAAASTVTFIKVVYTISWTSNTGRAYTHSAGAYLGRNGLHLSYQQS
jgi:hypothetical protein